MAQKPPFLGVFEKGQKTRFLAYFKHFEKRSKNSHF
jgi:hypothetical protein